MTAASMQGDPRPPDRVRHSWRCVRRGPLLEAVRLSNGEALIVSECGECHGTDLADRVRTQAAERGGPT